MSATLPMLCVDNALGESCTLGAECCVCYMPMDSAQSYTLECGHTYHTSCIVTWFRSGNTCPLCRKQPAIVMKRPDVNQRALMRLQSRDNPQPLQQEIDKLRRLEHELEMEVLRLKEYLEKWTVETVVHKNKLLNEYRKIRRQFRASTTPILKEMHRIDRSHSLEKADIMKEIRLKKRFVQNQKRAVGLWEP